MARAIKLISAETQLHHSSGEVVISQATAPSLHDAVVANVARRKVDLCSASLPSCALSFPRSLRFSLLFFSRFRSRLVPVGLLVSPLVAGVISVARFVAGSLGGLTSTQGPRSTLVVYEGQGYSCILGE